MKKLIIAATVLLVVAIVGIYFLLTNLDSIARSLIEKAGTEALGTDVSVETVHISLSEGQAVIKNLTVANPQGYSSQPAMHFAELVAEIDPKSKAINRVFADEPIFRIEAKEKENNFSALRNQIKGNEATRASPTSQSARKETIASSPVFTIKVFEVKNARIIATDQKGTRDEIVLSKLVIKNLQGTGQDIATQIVHRILGKIIVYEAQKVAEQQIRKAVDNHGGKKVRKILEDILGN